MGWTRAFSRNGSPLLLQHRRASSASAAPVWAHAMPCNCSNINASEHHQHQLSPCRLTRCCVTAPKPTQPSILSISCPLAGSRDALSLPSSQQASIISISCPRAGSRDALSLLRRQHSPSILRHQLPPCGLTQRFVTAIIKASEHHQHQLSPCRLT